ncbi:DUF302 domain-containing protein [Psychrobacter pygoscelis]|uniref:DUF302 domain-containing protein n=1 Tax=Psychrobacter pygoscelis TaxID=2488563 RepID=UPI001038F7C3|nr:DUF302 domain-containing protein [Psychrobacter pygoscelis]
MENTMLCKSILKRASRSNLVAPSTLIKLAMPACLVAALLTLTGCNTLMTTPQPQQQSNTSMKNQLTTPNNTNSVPTSDATSTANNSMTDHLSPYDFATTSSRVQAVIEQSPANLFATVPHSKGAQKVGMTLNPTTLFIFGNPKVGTPVLQANQKLAMELPIKILVWEDDQGVVHVSQQDFVKLAHDYNVDSQKLAPLDKAVKTIIQAALK